MVWDELNKNFKMMGSVSIIVRFWTRDSINFNMNLNKFLLRFMHFFQGKSVHIDIVLDAIVLGCV